MSRACSLLLLLLWLGSASAFAQASPPQRASSTSAGLLAPAAAPAARLRQMEEIYQKELSARHLPLLEKYLAELQRQAAATTDKAAYEAEIARVQQIITAGGAVDLIAAQRAQSGTMPAPMPAPVPPERKEALIALSPALAQRLAPEAEPNSATAVLGEGEWRIEFIAAGSYDILLHYACPDMTAAVPVRVEFGGQVVERTLETSRATKDALTFRIFRVGTLALSGDHRGETLRLVAGDKSAPKLILKSLLVTKPRAPAN